MQSDPSTPQYGKGKQGAPGSLGYCHLQVLFLQVCATNTGLWGNSWSGPWETGYKEWKPCQGVLQSLFLCCSYTWSLHDSVLLLLGSTIFCLVICEALQQCVFMPIRQCIRSPWQWLCSLGHQWISFLIQPAPKQELAPVIFFSSLHKFIIKKKPKQRETLNVDSKMYLLLFSPVVIKS